MLRLSYHKMKLCLSDEIVSLWWWNCVSDETVETLMKLCLSDDETVSLCIVLATWPFQSFVFYQRRNSHDIYFAPWGKIDSIFSYELLGSFWSVNWSRSWCLKNFRSWSRSRSLNAWSRRGVKEAWKIWLLLSLVYVRISYIKTTTFTPFGLDLDR